MKITLDVNSVDDIPEELYDMLLDRFYAKLESAGVDTQDPQLMIDQWQVTAEAVVVETDYESEYDKLILPS